jgi:hypothetical protein
MSLPQFLEAICSSYGLNYKLVGGTYVFYIDNQVKFTKAVDETPKRNNQRIELKPPDNVQKEYLVTGIVRNAVTGEKLKNSNLDINESNAQTNEMGFFTQSVTSSGEVKIAVNHVGFVPFDTLVTLQSSMPIQISLKPNRLSDNSFNLLPSGKFFLEMPKVTDMIAINPKSAFHLPGFEATDLAKVITTIPGINFLKGTNTGISIRGGNPSENLVLVDGIPVIETNHLMGNLSVLNSKFINEAYVSRGGFGVEYGGSTSGIVDLIGKTGNGKTPVVDFTANILQANLFVGLPINETTSMSGAFRKSLFDVWPKYLLENLPLEKVELAIDSLPSENGDVKNTIVNYYDANLKLSFRPSSRKEFTLSYLNSFDSQQRDYTFAADGDYFQNRNSKYNTTGYSANLKLQSIDNWLNSFTVSYNSLYSTALKEYGKKENKYGLRLRNLNDYSENNLQQFILGWKSEFKSKYFSHQFGLGYTADRLGAAYQIYEEKLPGVELKADDSISIASDLAQLNGYYQLKIEPFRWIRLRGGVRTLFNVENETFVYQPRYGVDIFTFPAMKLSYSAGAYNQHLYRTYRFDSNHNVSNIWYMAKNNEQYMNASHQIVGLGLEIKGFSLNVEAYQKANKGKNYFIANKEVTNGNNKVIYYQRSGGENNRGVDFYLQFQHHIFKHLITYSYSESKEMIDGVNGGNYFYSFDDQLQRLRISEVISFKGFTASANWFFASGNPYLLKSSTLTDFQFARFQDFSQLDISLIKEFRFKYLYADIGVTFLNVLNKRNEVGMEYYDVLGELSKHSFNSVTTSTFYTPLFFINFRYE